MAQADHIFMVFAERFLQHGVGIDQTRRQQLIGRALHGHRLRCPLRASLLPEGNQLAVDQ